MKILVFAGLIAGLSIKGFSQGPPELGVFAGPQITSAHYTVEGEKQETTYKFGYQEQLPDYLPVYPMRIYPWTNLLNQPLL
jgi:hypothetical protein